MNNKVELTVKEIVKLFAKVAPPDHFELSLVKEIDMLDDCYEVLVQNDFDETASIVYGRRDDLQNLLDFYRRMKQRHLSDEEHKAALEIPNAAARE